MKLEIVIRSLLIIVGTAIAINGIAMLMVVTFNLGSLLALMLGTVLALWGIYFDKVSQIFPLALRISVAAVLIIAVGFSGFLFVFGLRDNVSYKENAVIVLGAGVNGEKVSLALEGRLNAAVEYHKENPKALIVVSGGQGAGEDISEAEAMKRYLIEKGVPEAIIIKEDKSTSTSENFLFSKKKLDEIFVGEYTIAYITNDYHIYRAGGIAENAGFENPAHVHSGTLWHTVVPGTLRECLAVAKFLVFGT